MGNKIPFKKKSQATRIHDKQKVVIANVLFSQNIHQKEGTSSMKCKIAKQSLKMEKTNK